MLGYDKSSYAYEHDNGRKQNAMLVGCKDRFARFMLIDTALGYKDSIVITLTEDKRSKDDIHDIELDAEYSHESEDPHPTDNHRHK